MEEGDLRQVRNFLFIIILFIFWELSHTSLYILLSLYVSTSVWGIRTCPYLWRLKISTEYLPPPLSTLTFAPGFVTKLAHWLTRLCEWQAPALPCSPAMGWDVDVGIPHSELCPYIASPSASGHLPRPCFPCISHATLFDPIKDGFGIVVS